MALANQAKLTPTKNDSMMDGDDDHDDDEDDTSMSTDEYKTPRKSIRGKSNKTKQQIADAIQYGPIVVKPRKNVAPTLANGRRSKDEPVCELISIEIFNMNLFCFSF